MDISGSWHFREDFGYGVDEGDMTINQNGTKFTGSMVYEETIEGDQPFVVCVDIEGMIVDDQIRFKGINYEIFDDTLPDMLFNLEDRQGRFIDENRIEGLSMDTDGIEGHFVMIKNH
ncbi:MAG: hypothetical protein QM786_04860 [Breznakibacter sp.]